MGLRTPSVNNEALTNKQRDMLTARNPMNNNEMNQQAQEQKELNRQVDTQRKGVATQQQAQQTGMVTPPVAAMPQQSVASTQRNLQSLSNRYMAKVNNILAGGDINQLAAKDIEPVFVPGVGWQLPSTDEFSDLFDVSGLAAQKQAGISGLKEEMSPYFDYTDTGDKTTVTAKSFDETLAQFADVNQDGIISDDERQFLNEAIDIAAMLERLNRLDPNSPEAKALEMQLGLLDKTGLVSGIQRAYDQYRRIVGTGGKGGTFYGPEGQTIDLEELINLSTKDIEDNLMYVLTGEKPSIFGGDFKQALKNTNMLTRTQKARQLDSETRNAITNATENWALNTQEAFSQYNDAIKQNFAGAYEQAQNKFAQMLEGAQTEEQQNQIKAAWQWFDDLFTGPGKDDPGKVMEELLSSESGLALSHRLGLAKWLGSAVGVDSNVFQSGIIKDVLDDIASQGYAEVDIRDENGNVQLMKFELDDSDRLKIAQILYSDLPESEKQDRIENIVDDKIRKRFDSSGDLRKIEQYFANGQLNSGLDAFVDSIVQSLNTFNNSLTQEMYNEIVGKGAFSQLANAPEGADPRDYIDMNKVENIFALATEKSQERAKKLTDTASSLKSALDFSKAQAEEDLQKLQDVKTVIANSAEQGLAQVRAALINRVTQDRLPQYSTSFDSAMSQLFGPNYNPNDMNAQAAKQAYTIAATLNQIAQHQPDTPLGRYFVQSAPEFVKNFITQPNKVLDEYYATTMGNGNVATIATSMKSFIEDASANVAKEVYDSSSSGKLLKETYNNVNRDISNASQFLSTYANTAEALDGVVRAATEELANVSAYSPEDVANLALQEARRFEGGEQGAVRFIQMLPSAISKDNFEDKVSKLTSATLYTPATTMAPSGTFDYVAPEFSHTPGMQTLETWKKDRIAANTPEHPKLTITDSRDPLTKGYQWVERTLGSIF